MLERHTSILIVLLAVVAIVAGLGALFLVVRSAHQEREPAVQTSVAPGERDSDNVEHGPVTAKANERKHEPEGAESQRYITTLAAEWVVENTNTAWHWIASSERMMLLFNGILAFATILLVVFNGALWNETQRSVSIAEDANRLTRQQLEMAERPWVSVLPVLVSGVTHDANGSIFWIEFLLSNTGRPPAVHAFVTFGVVADVDLFAVVAKQRELCGAAKIFASGSAFP